MSFDLIFPYLPDLVPFILDPEISEIMVNPPVRVFIEKNGKLEAVDGLSLGEKALQIAVQNIARLLSDDIDEKKPVLSARLPDGSRVEAIFPPTSVGGTTLNIRKFQSRYYSAEELVRLDSLTSGTLEFLRRAVERRRSILISGGCSVGKTTLLSALAAFMGAEERIVLIEDTCEIHLEHKNLVRLEARRQQPHLPAVTIQQLLMATLRLRPDRIIVGEVRDGSAFDLLSALNTGHDGMLCTLHANSAEDSLSRFSTYVLQAGIDLPYVAIRRNIADALNLLVHLKRHEGKRQITQVLEIKGYDPVADCYRLETVYQRDLSNGPRHSQ